MWEESHALFSIRIYLVIEISPTKRLGERKYPSLLREGGLYMITINSIKKKYIGARVTLEQKEMVKKLVEKAGFETESEYVLHCCLYNHGIRLQSTYQLNRVRVSKSNRHVFRLTDDENKQIIKRYEESRINNFSKFVRNCCMSNPIIIIEDLKEFARDLHKVGNNLNQLTMLCHQGLVTVPDISETKGLLNGIYKELTNLNKKIKVGR